MKNVILDKAFITQSQQSEPHMQQIFTLSFSEIHQKHSLIVTIKMFARCDCPQKINYRMNEK